MKVGWRSFAGRRGFAVVATATALAVGIPAGAFAVGGLPNGDRTADARAAIKGGAARNVILLIGDGMGDSEITSARNYQVGAAGRMAMDGLPLTGAYTTYAVQKDNPKLPDYVTDSAASGTGWATGRKTYNGAISVLPDGKPVPTVLEKAKKAGFRTGDVTTAEVQDATPAVLGAHVVDRDCKGPDETTKKCPTNAKEKGGAGSISEQLVQTRPDVLLGGGSSYFDQKVTAGRYKGLPVRYQATGAGYQIATNDQELTAARPDRPLLGLFAPKNMAVDWTGPTPTKAGTSPQKCTANPQQPATQPKLAKMANKALTVLDKQTAGKKKGFFLQIEGASIDKQDHAADPCGQIGETVGFDAAVKTALTYQKKVPNTLVVVTADHGHTSQIVGAGAKTTGVTATLLTKDNAPMTISYATATPPASQEHTGTQVRIAASGPQAANVLGVTDQTALFTTMNRALGLTN